MKTQLTLITSLVTLSCLAPLASADSVGVNFVGGRSGYTSTNGTVTGPAGVYYTKTWNNLADNGGGTTSGNEDGSANNLVNNYGYLTTLDVVWDSTNTYAATTGAVTDQDRRLINGYLDNNSGSPNTTVTVSEIPYSAYLVYAYFGSDGNGRTGTVSIGSTSYGYSTNTAGFGSANDYVLTTSTGGSPSANYAVFGGLTADSFTLTNSRGSNNTGLHGLQIVEAPTIGINFVGGSTSVTPTAMGSSEVAGVIAQANWNNASGASGSQGGLTDQHGKNTGISVAWNAGDGTWATGTPDTAGDSRMMKGYLDNFGNGGDDTTVTVSNIHGAGIGGYDVYVYFDGSNGSEWRQAIFEILDSDGNFATDAGEDSEGNDFNTANVNFQYQLPVPGGTGNLPFVYSPNNDEGNYIILSGLTGDSFTLTAFPGGGASATLRAPINGIQIVATNLIPAPAALPAGLAMLTLAAARRRRR